MAQGLERQQWRARLTLIAEASFEERFRPFNLPADCPRLLLRCPWDIRIDFTQGGPRERGPGPE